MCPIYYNQGKEECKASRGELPLRRCNLTHSPQTEWLKVWGNWQLGVMLVGLSACAKVQHWVLDNQNLTAPAPVGLGWFIQGWFLRPEVCYKKNICQEAQAQSFATEDESVQ